MLKTVRLVEQLSGEKLVYIGKADGGSWMVDGGWCLTVEVESLRAELAELRAEVKELKEIASAPAGPRNDGAGSTGVGLVMWREVR